MKCYYENCKQKATGWILGKTYCTEHYVELKNFKRCPRNPNKKKVESLRKRFKSRNKIIVSKREGVIVSLNDLLKGGSNDNCTNSN